MPRALLSRRAAKPLGRCATGAFLCLVLSLPGCTVIAVTGTAISVTAGAVGLAADAAIGTAKIVGKGVGKAADALLEDDPPQTQAPLKPATVDVAPVPATALPPPADLPQTAR